MALLSSITGEEIPLQVPENLWSMTKEELADLLVKMAQDWQMLNAIHNRRADDHGWCSEYEERQRAYNNTLHILKLQPRNIGLQASAEATRGFTARGL